MKNQTEGVTLKARLLQDAQILLWGLLTLAILVLAVLELFTGESYDTLYVKERVKVSSSVISMTEQNYLCAVDGRLYNPTDEAIVVKELIVTVGNGKGTRRVEFEGFTLPPRTVKDLSATWTAMTSYQTVEQIRVKTDKEEMILSNLTDDSSPISGGLIFYAVLLIPCALLLIRSSKIRYYLWQEAKMEK